MARMPAASADGEGEISIAEILHILWFRRRLLLTTALFIIAVGVIYVNQLVPRYSATSTVMISTPKVKVSSIDDILAGAMNNDAEILGELEVLQSRGLAQKVVEKLNLTSMEEFNPRLRTRGLLSYLSPKQWIPESWKESFGMQPTEGVVLSDAEKKQNELAVAANILLAKLRVEQVKYSNVARITFESTQPRTAAIIANELPEAYIIDQMEAKFEATEKTTKWLDEQLTDLRQKVEDSERAVEIYRNQHGLTESKGVGILGSQVSEVNSQLVIARAERVQAEARLKQVVHLTQGSSADLESAAEVMSSSLIQRLKEQEASITRSASELSVEYGPKHPKMLQVNAQKEVIQERIKQEIQKIVAGLKNEMDVALSKENSLSASLKDLEQQAGQQKKETVQLSVLEREASANRTLFDTFLNRFKETSSTTGMQEADARVISKAEIPGSPSYPNKRLFYLAIIAGAFLASMALVYFVHALNPGLLNPEQIENELGYPTIGMIPVAPLDKPHDYVLEKPNSSFSEALNSLKTSLILS